MTTAGAGMMGRAPRSPLEEAQAKLEAAEREVAVLKEEAEAVRATKRRQAAEERFQAMMSLPDSAFYTMNPRWDERPYVLPFGKDYPKWNPTGNDVEHHFGATWTANSTAIICERTDQDRSGPTRLIWTFGQVMPRDGERVGSGDLIGTPFLARHDQTGAKLGEYVIVGLAFYGPEGGSHPARTVGDVPDRKFGQSTYK